MSPYSPPPGKPSLRGLSHLAAVPLALYAALLLAQRPEEARMARGVLVYCMTMVMLFAISGFYHAPNWAPAPRAFLKRLDHSMIYLFVASGFTPVFMALNDADSRWVLPVVWSAAIGGCIKSIAFPKGPRALTAGLFAALGLVAAPFIPRMAEQLGPHIAWLIIGGGLAYLLGAVAYARKWPNVLPGHFGYHELFHVMVIAGVALHYTAIWLVVGP